LHAPDTTPELERKPPALHLRLIACDVAQLAVTDCDLCAISRELGERFYFPGTPRNYGAIYQCTDACLLARAIVWIASGPRCADQAFNVTNGDFFRWKNLWPVFARYFGIELGPIRTVKLADTMPARAPIWRKIVEKHRLVDTPYERMALWRYGDFIFTPHWDICRVRVNCVSSDFTSSSTANRCF